MTRRTTISAGAPVAAQRRPQLGDLRRIARSAVPHFEDPRRPPADEGADPGVGGEHGIGAGRLPHRGEPGSLGDGYGFVIACEGLVEDLAQQRRFGPERGGHGGARDAGEGESLWFLGNLATIKTAGPHTRGALTVVEFLNPAGFAPPVHRHLVEDEAFCILSGQVRFRCDDQDFDAGPGDFVLLPVDRPHTFLVGPDQPLRALQITTPAGFERFAAEVGEPAAELRLPDPGPIDPTALGHAAARHSVELLGPPPHH